MGVQINGSEGNVIATKGTFSGDVGIGGTLTYEDVTNIDSVGLVTARTGIEIGARPGVAASISVDGNMIISGISTFGGDVQVPDKIIHSGDTNTAIRFPAADTITAETGGSERLRINSSGQMGLGMTPTRMFEVKDSTDANRVMNIRSTGTSGAYLAFLDANTTDDSKVRIGSVGGDDIVVRGDTVQFATGAGSEFGRFDSSGRLLIGTTTEGYSSADDLTVSTSGHTGITIRSGDTSLGTLAFSDGTSGAAEYDGYIQYSQNDRYMDFATGGGNIRLRITSGGDMGLGTDSPNSYSNQRVFTINGTNYGRLDLEVSGTLIGSLWADSGGLALDAGGNEIEFYTGSAERARINSDGSFGINTTAPVEKLGISGNMRFVNPNGTTSRITALPSGTYSTGTSGGSAVCFQRTAEGGGGSDEIFFETHWQGNRHAESARVSKYGGITFNGDTAAANALDDYEEGTWTPALHAGETCSVYKAKYTKIGRLVTAYCYIYNFSDFNGNSNNFNITGLPFNASGSDYHGGGFIGYAANFNYSYPLLPLVVQSSATGYFHRQDGTTANWTYQDFHNTGNGSNGQLLMTFVYEST